MKKKDYEVGYSKPPKATQFKKGKSGNKRGRPKGTRNFDTDLQAVLNTKVSITEGGELRKVSSQLAVLMQLRAQALQGDLKAMAKLIDLAKEQNDETSSCLNEGAISQSEQEILARFIADIINDAEIAEATTHEGGEADESH